MRSLAAFRLIALGTALPGAEVISQSPVIIEKMKLVGNSA